MWTVLRSKSPWKLGFQSLNNAFFSSPSAAAISCSDGLLDLHEVEKILTDVKADNIRVLPASKRCEWADFTVIATGRSTWHVRNIAQALVYKVKQKQKGATRMVLPSIEGQEAGKWIVIDSGKVVIHALDENAREYYNLEDLWTKDPIERDPMQDLQNCLTRIRRKNNSKKSQIKRAG